MKAVIFVPSNAVKIRGSEWLAQKAGFFCLHAKGVFLPIKRRPAIITEPRREAMPAEVVRWTAVIGGPLFCPLTNVQRIHYAHRNKILRRPAQGQGAPDHSGQIAAPRGGNLATTARIAPRFYSTKARAFGADKTPIINSISVT